MTQGIAEVNEINIWWEDFGNPSNPSVLLIMGANANCMQWTPEFIDPLVDAGFHHKHLVILLLKEEFLIFL